MYGKILVAFVLASIFVLVPGLLLYFLGYEARQEWNHGYVETGATIHEQRINRYACSWECDCIQICTEYDQNSNCIVYSDICQTCYGLCLDPEIYLVFSVSSTNDTTTTTTTIDQQQQQQVWYQPCDTQHYESDANSCLAGYPINSTIKIYYNPLDPTQLALTQYETKGYFIAAWTVLSLYILLVFAIAVTFCFIRVKTRQTLLHI